MHLKRVTTLLMILFLSFSLLAFPGVLGAIDPTVKCYSDVSELGDSVSYPDVVGTEFDVAIVVEDVIDLYGFDIQFNWTTEWLHYTGYSIYVPVDDYPDAIPPSPYSGILWKPTMELSNVVDEADAIPLGEPGAMAWIGYSSKAPAPSFDGNGTMCVFTFNVVDQPYKFEEPSGVTVGIHFILTSLSFSNATAIDHVAEDLEITLHPRLFTYAPRPMLKVMPELVTGYGVCETFDVDVYLMDEEGNDLDPFWDVAGCDFYLNFNTTLLEAVSATIDPDGDFGDPHFWSKGILEGSNEINNVEGWVHIAFFGWGEHPLPVAGTIRVATVTFHVPESAQSETYPPPTEPIYLENPNPSLRIDGWVPSIWYILDAKGVVIDLSAPISTDLSAVFPISAYSLPFHITDWEDVDGDGELSVGDQIILLNEETLKWHDYYVDRVAATLNLTQLPFGWNDEYLAMDCPTHGASPWPKTADTGGYFNGYGLPYWTGNFSCTYPVESVNYIEVTPQIGAPYNLTEGTDFVVNPDGTIELKTALDEDVLNELIGTMPVADAGWPALEYTASGISSVWIEMLNGTKRYGKNIGYNSGNMDPAGEWWFDPDYPYELESYFATGYFPGPWVWPDGTDIYVNYTAAAFMYVDYNAKPDPRPFYMENDDFGALADPIATLWDEAYPNYDNTWNITEFTDDDTSGDITAGDHLTMEIPGVMTRPYLVNAVSTDIHVIEKRCVQDKVPGEPFYTEPITVDIAGFPHPDRPMSPWYGSESAMPLPSTVENGAFTAPFAPPGRWIDVYTCSHPETFKGKGLNEPCDAFGPQATVCLCAEVTYNLNPVQQKKVSFQIEHGEWDLTFCDITDENGIACIEFGLPWPCTTPEDRVFGTWDVTATVDIREVVVIDTMNFTVGYLIDIISVEPQPDDVFEIGEHMSFKVTYNSISKQDRTAYFTIVVCDDLGVPIGWMTVGPITVVYGEDFIILECMEVPKHTFVGQGTVYANILNKMPSDGGVQYCPEETIFIGLVIP